MGHSYLVTGGSGFIGSHLVDALLARGDQVVALDNLSTGRLANLSAAMDHPNFRFVHGSVLDELMVDELVNTCDTVVHLAAAVGVKLIVEQPLRSVTTNIRGSEIVIGSAHRFRRKVLVASTSEIYGKNGAGPLSETSDRILGATIVAAQASELINEMSVIMSAGIGMRQLANIIHTYPAQSDAIRLAALAYMGNQPDFAW